MRASVSASASASTSASVSVPVSVCDIHTTDYGINWIFCDEWAFWRMSRIPFSEFSSNSQKIDPPNFLAYVSCPLFQHFSVVHKKKNSFPKLFGICLLLVS